MATPLLIAAGICWLAGPPALLVSQAYQFLTIGGWTPLTAGDQQQATWFAYYWAICFLLTPVLGALVAAAARRHVSVVAFVAALAISVFLSFADGIPWMLGDRTARQ